MDIAKMISERLKAWMSETPSLNTLQKLEQKSGVGFGTIRRARNGDGNITVEKLTLIAQAFGRHPSELMADAPSESEKYATPLGSSVIAARELPQLPYQAQTLPREIEQLMDIAQKLDDVGRGMLLERARQIAQERATDNDAGNIAISA